MKITYRLGGREWAVALSCSEGSKVGSRLGQEQEAGVGYTAKDLRFHSVSERYSGGLDGCVTGWY